ncbi:MAG: hypothetical protein ACYC6W_03175 [Nitrosotalea sp.]
MLVQHISWSAAHVVDVKAMNSKTIRIIENKKLESDFEPSIKTLSNIPGIRL